jgi:hypothetical protein
MSKNEQSYAKMRKGAQEREKNCKDVPSKLREGFEAMFQSMNIRKGEKIFRI